MSQEPKKEGTGEAAPEKSTNTGGDLAATVQQLSDKLKTYETRIAFAERDLETTREENTNLKRKAAEKGGDKEKGEFEEHLKNQYETRYGKKFTEMDAELKATKSEIKSLRVTNVGLQKASEIGFIPQATPILEREINDKCDWVDGRVVVKDGLDGEGKPKYKFSAENPKEYMGLDEFLGGLAKQFDFMVASTQRQGTRAEGNRNTNNSSNTGAVPRPPAGFENFSQGAKEKWFRDNPEGARAYMKTASFN